MSVNTSPTPSPSTSPPNPSPSTLSDFSMIILPLTFMPPSSPSPDFDPHCTFFELDLRHKYFRVQQSWNDTQSTLRQLFSLLHDVCLGNTCSLSHFLGIRGSVPVWEFEEEAELGYEILADIAAVESEIPELRRERDRILTHLNVLKAGEEWDQRCRDMEGTEEQGWEGDRWGVAGFGGLELVMEENEGTDEEEDKKANEGGAGNKNEIVDGEKCPGDEYVLELPATLWSMAHQIKSGAVATFAQEAAFYSDPQQERQQGEEEEKEQQAETEDAKQDNTWEGFLEAEAMPIEIPVKSPWEMHEELREILAFEMGHELMRNYGVQWES